MGSHLNSIAIRASFPSSIVCIVLSANQPYNLHGATPFSGLLNTTINPQAILKLHRAKEHQSFNPLVRLAVSLPYYVYKTGA